MVLDLPMLWLLLCGVDAAAVVMLLCLLFCKGVMEDVRL